MTGNWYLLAVLGKGESKQVGEDIEVMTCPHTFDCFDLISSGIHIVDRRILFLSAPLLLRFC